MTDPTNADSQRTTTGGVTELLPCPFCGTVPTEIRETDGYKWGAVVCCITGPEVRTSFEPVEKWRDAAIEEWNRRATPARSSLPLAGSSPVPLTPALSERGDGAAKEMLRAVIHEAQHMHSWNDANLEGWLRAVLLYAAPPSPVPGPLSEAARALVFRCMEASDKAPFLVAEHPDSFAIDALLWELEVALREDRAISFALCSAEEMRERAALVADGYVAAALVRMRETQFEERDLADAERATASLISQDIRALSAPTTGERGQTKP